jgi:hypothetical protein
MLVLGVPPSAGALPGVAHTWVRRKCRNDVACSVVSEVEVEDDVPLVVGRLPEALVGGAGGGARAGEPFERGEPGVEVGDRVLDVQGRHGVLRVGRLPATVGIAAAIGYPN